jgi:hypothetical protein
MIVSRNAVTSVLALLLILLALVAAQMWQTSRVAAQKEAQRRAEGNAVQQEFGQARAGSGSTL